MDNQQIEYENMYETSIIELDKLRNQLKEENIDLEEILEYEMETDFGKTKSQFL